MLEVLVVPFSNAVERANYVEQTRRAVERRTDDNNSGHVVEAEEEGGTLTIHVYPLEA